MVEALAGRTDRIWLQGSPTEARLAATSMSGLGGHVTYAYNRPLVVEVEALGARTGQARFADASYAGKIARTSNTVPTTSR